MGFRFHKRINLFGGAFRINFTKSGIGYSYGGKGARVTKKANGRTRTTLSVPGTGISYVIESSSKRRTKSRNIQQNTDMTQQDLKNGYIGLGIIILFIIICIAFGFVPAMLSLFCFLFVLSTVKINKIKRAAINTAIEEENWMNQRIGGNQSDK